MQNRPAKKGPRPGMIRKTPMPDEPRPERVTEGNANPSTNDGYDYSASELEFMLAMYRFKMTYNRQFPTWSEVLAVVKSLGYHQDENVGAGDDQKQHQ
jgi:hypothetical protein